MSRRWRGNGWLADVAILLCVALALRGPTIGISEIDWDESNFALVARELLHGHWPYSTVFDHKPIALYLHYAAALSLFGDSPTAIRLLGIATAAASALLVHLIATHRLGLSRIWGLFLGACYLLATTGFGGQAVYSEHLVNLYLLLSALLLRDTRWPRTLLSGLAAGIAININYLALPVVAGLLAGHLIGLRVSGQRQRPRLLFFAAGTILSTALVLLPVVLFSDVGGYFAVQLQFLSGYSAHRSITGTFADFGLQGAALLPLVAVAGALAFSLRDPPNGRASPYYPWLFAGMGFGSAAAALASGYVFDHYMLLAVPAVLLLVASLVAISIDELRTFSAAIVGATALMIAMPGLFQSALGGRNLVQAASGDVSGDLARELARIARPRVEPGSNIYSVCAPLALYQLLDARPVTRYPFYPFNLQPQYASALGIDIDAEVAAIFARRPAVVVFGEYDDCWAIPRSSWQKVRDALQRNGYRPFATYQSYSFLAPSAEARTAVTK